MELDALDNREFAGGATCRAPFTSLHLDPSGHVRVCELNSLGMLGRIPESRLVDLWRGERVRRIRQALRDDDLTVGCEDCVRPLRAGTRELAHAHYYDRFAMPSADPPEWPVQLELSLSNACNLQCVMCNGDLSSSIRTHREHLPPLPRVYDDRFFDDLALFLPHLEHVTFIGGEPFLGPESLRVFDMLMDLDRPPTVGVTTNGTVLTPRVERILQALPVEISVSVDGATAATYERIRPGSDFATVMHHVARFRELARHVSLNTCLMTENWSEFAALLLLADGLDLDVHVNTVIAPKRYSLYHLPADRLAAVLESMRAACDVDSLGRNRTVWDRQLRRLGDHLEALQLDVPRPTAVSVSRASAARIAARGADDRGVHVIDIGPSEQILAIRPDPRDVLGLDLRGLIGGHLTALVGALTGAFGDLEATSLEYHPDGLEDRTMAFTRDGVRTTVRAVLGDGDPATMPPVTSRWHLAARIETVAPASAAP